MNELEKLKQQRAELDELIAQAEKALLEPWPRVGEDYWFAGGYGEAIVTKNTKGRIDNNNIATGNCFRTKAEAIAYSDYQTDPRVVARGMVERMPGFDPLGAYEICIERLALRVTKPSNSSGTFIAAGLTYTDAESAQIVVDTFGDLLKVASGVITGDRAREIVRQAIWRVNEGAE